MKNQIVNLLFLAGVAVAQPVITSNGVVNAAGYQTRLAPDTVFVVFGSGMGPASIVTATAPSYPSTLGGTSVSLTPATGGSVINAAMVYTIASQIAGLLPSSITPGTYALRVTYNGQPSAPQNVTVVARSFGIAAANSAGNGLAQATIGTVNGGLSLTRFTAGSVAFGGYNWTLGPAHPGDTIVLWGTGGGADPANDTGGTSGDQTAAGNFVVLVDGRKIIPLYAGASSGYPGLWQINFMLPADITLNCFALVQVSAGTDLSNKVTIPIAGAGQTSCVDPAMSTSVLTKLDAGQNITFGAFAIAKLNSTSAGVVQETASGSVFSYNSTEWIILNSGPVYGSCRLYDRTFPVGGRDPGSPDAFLDAGSKLGLAGPNLGANSALGTINTAIGPAYGGSLSTGTLTSGTYTLTGPGGTQVGTFTVSVTFPDSFTVTNWNSITSIDRSQPLTFNWTGSGFDSVGVVLSTAVVANGTQHLSTLNCMLPGAPGTYTIPPAALANLSVVPASGTSFGTFSLQGIKQGTFTANLVKGGQLDLGVFSANLGVAKNLAVQ
jgi:uncharacterized protein (TIGR03437 family)